MYASNKACDNFEKLSAAMSAIISDAANREISQWITDQRNRNGLFRDDDNFETLEYRLLEKIYLSIDEIEVIFISASKDRELVTELFRTIKDKYAKVVKVTVSSYRETILKAEEQLLNDAASEFNDFMMKGNQ